MMGFVCGLRRVGTTILMTLLAAGPLAAGPAEAKPRRPRIAVFSGPNSTMQNTPPLVTSNKARAARGLPLLAHADGSPLRFDHLAPQRLAAPVEVFIEPFTAHPLERDAAALYGPPDGYLDAQGVFHPQRRGPADRPVHRVTLRPEDGLYLLPYMATQADGKPWDGVCAWPGAPVERCRQSFYPDASRLFEEIDRGVAGRGFDGKGDLLAGLADYDFIRAAPSGGYTQGVKAGERTDAGRGDIAPEIEGEHYFPYAPRRREARLEDLALVTNAVHRTLRAGGYDGALLLESSMTVHETSYWLNLLIDTTVPIAASASQRVHQAAGNDGDRNAVDAVRYLLSRAWIDAKGRNAIGAVLVQDDQILFSRQAEKEDMRPGGYRAAGGHGGVLGTTDAPVVLWFRPGTRHTWNSDVRLSQLPARVQGVTLRDGKPASVTVQVKDADGLLRGDAVPKVTMVRYNHFIHDSAQARAEEEAEALARIDKNLHERPLSGFVAEGLVARGLVHDSLERALERAAMSGMPVVRVSRGDEGAMVAADPTNLTVEGNNLTAGKARFLLMACLLKFGAPPPAADPRQPTAAEKKAVQRKLALYQAVFDTH